MQLKIRSGIDLMQHFFRVYIYFYKKKKEMSPVIQMQRIILFFYITMQRIILFITIMLRMPKSVFSLSFFIEFRF